ncbi:TcpE family conjugal transfer membrane protein [Paracerasibacillus soli]|uniref:TcpE family conjugal transfer membrane protein n=1 Tax=Paracerasibacillus soli TaxID=480284 RepID=UPI00387E1508
MKKLKSYTRIWSVEKVIYAINDFRLPFPSRLIKCRGLYFLYCLSWYLVIFPTLIDQWSVIKICGNSCWLNMVYESKNI